MNSNLPPSSLKVLNKCVGCTGVNFLDEEGGRRGVQCWKKAACLAGWTALWVGSSFIFEEGGARNTSLLMVLRASKGDGLALRGALTAFGGKLGERAPAASSAKVFCRICRVNVVASWVGPTIFAVKGGQSGQKMVLFF